MPFGFNAKSVGGGLAGGTFPLDPLGGAVVGSVLANNHKGLGEFDPGSTQGRKNILTGGSLAPWNLWKQGRDKVKGYEIDANAFKDPNAEANRGRYLGEIGQNDASASQYGSQQHDLVNALIDQANGKGPSLAQGQLQMGADRAMRQQASIANSARGGNRALAQRTAAYGQAGIGADMAGQAANLRMSEQMNARQQLGDVLAGARGQDLGMQQFYEGQNSGNDANSFLAGQNLENLRVNQDLGIKGIQQHEDDSARKGFGGLVSGGAGAAGALLGSDERMKTNIKDGNRGAEDFLDTLSAKQFEYKDPAAAGAAPGARIGVMAQDVEQSPAGRQVVTDTAQGKVLDQGQSLGAALAGMANLHERLKKMEGKGAGGGSPALADRASKGGGPSGPSASRSLLDWLMKAHPGNERLKAPETMTAGTQF